MIIIIECQIQNILQIIKRLFTILDTLKQFQTDIQRGPIGEGQEEKINQIFKRKKIKPEKIKPKKPDKIKVKIIIIISSIVISALVIGLCLFFLVFKNKKKKKNEDEKKNYQEEKLIVKLNYIPNNLLKFRSKKKINLEVNTNESEDNDSNSNENNKKNMTQYTDFIFIIREKKIKKMKII